MRINRLILKNYRCFENLDIALHNRLTVIVGTNGSGKTSVLEGATVALGTFFTAFDGIRELRIAKKDVRLKTYSMGETDDVQPQYPVEIYAEGETDGREISWKRSLQSEEGRTTRGDAHIQYFYENGFHHLTSASSIMARIAAASSAVSLPLLVNAAMNAGSDPSKESSTNCLDCRV